MIIPLKHDLPLPIPDPTSLPSSIDFFCFQYDKYGRYVGAQPSDLCPSALHFPTDELKAFPLSATIAFNCADAWNSGRLEMAPTAEDIYQADHPAASAARDGAACRQHDLRDGAARRISAALRPLAPLRRLGPGGGRSLAGLAPISPDRPRAISRCQATAIAPGSRAGSGSSSGIEGGMSTGTRFLPATQASMMSDHSCIIWRRCTSYSALL